MRNIYSIKNFRVFDHEGVELNIKPLTILTGCNSSGKSSIVKSLVLLNDFLSNILLDKQNNQPIRLHKYQLNFTKKPNNLLGSFKKIRHHQESSDNSEPITFSYNVYSDLLEKEVRITLDFNDRDGSDGTNGYLTGFSIQESDGQVIYSSRSNDDLQAIASGQQLVEDVMTKDMTDSLGYVSSSIITIKRLYPLEIEDEFTGLLKQYLKSAKAQHRADYEPTTFINKWVKKFGIGEQIVIETDPDQLGAVIRLRMKGEKKGAILADFGYGISQLFAIMLRIELAILEGKQSMTLALEEPEVHLHPRFQSILTEMIADAYKNYNIQFIIETHSEYIVRKLQTLVAQQTINSDDVALIYVYDADPQKRPMYVPQIKQIEIEDDGRLNDAPGSGFLDEANNLSIDLLRTMRED